MNSSITAGTFFHRVRKLRAWFAAIWFSENGALICSTTFSKFLRVAQSSALHIVKSIRGAIDLYCSENVDSRLPVNTVHFIELFDRRSILTYRLMPPYLEEQEASARNNESRAFDSSEANQENGMDAKVAANPAPIDQQKDLQDCQSLSETDSLVLSCLNHGSMTIDELAAAAGLSHSQVYESLIELELSGEIEPQPGGRFNRSEKRKQFKLTLVPSSSDGKNSKDTERYWWEFIDSESTKLLWQDLLKRGQAQKSTFEAIEEHGLLRNLSMWQIARARIIKREQKDLSAFSRARCNASSCSLCTTAN